MRPGTQENEYSSSFGNAAKDDSESRREDLELVFANLAHATFLLDQDGRISDANPAACTLLEYQKEELLSRELSDLVTATVREDTLKLVRSLEIEVPLTVQCSFGTRKGEDVFVELRLARYFSKARVSIIASCRNVADQQRARADLESALAKLNRSELRLRRSEATLAEAQKLSHTGSVFWRPSTGQIKWSEETYRIYGYSPEIKPTMQLVRQRVHPDDRALFDETALQAPQKGEDLQFESRLLMPNGEVKHIRFVSRAMRNSTGELEFYGVVMDVTAQRLAQQSLESALQKLRQSEAYLAEAQRLSRTGSFGWNVVTGELVWSDETFCILV